MPGNSKDKQTTSYPICSDLNKIASHLKEHGVCVIPNVFSSVECDSWMKEILSCIETLSGNKVDHNKPTEWSGDELPPQTRYGMHQYLVNNLKPIWEIRRDPRMKGIFQPVYTELKGKNIDEFVCSIDGVSIQPNVSRDIGKEKDWAHLDQTSRDDVFKCVQGQVVLTNTKASFRASPRIHKHFIEIMEMCGVPDTNRNFYKFDDDQIENIMTDIVLPNNIPYQIPINAEKGSVILWLSSTAHSSMSARFKELPTIEDPFKGWRGVAYVCYRPKEDFSTDQLNALEDCLEANHGTNHWSDMVFPEFNNRKGVSISPNMQRLLQNPKQVYEELNFKPDKSFFLIE